jgi:hypothetical protein
LRANSTERSGQRDRGGVGAATTQRGDGALGRHALESGDDADLAALDRVADAVALDLDDFGLAV